LSTHTTASPLSLTRAEAEERAALVEVRRYDIDVDLTALPTGPDVRATSRIDFGCREPGASTFVDCVAEVVSATLNGEPVGPPEGGRLPLDGLRADNVLVVETVQTDTAEGCGVHRAVDPADGEVYLWTSFEPDEARYVWACFDQPDLKAVTAFTVLAPAAWRVVSNMSDTAVVPEGDARRWTFAPTPPLSTYNPVVVAGPFSEIRRDQGGHDLGILARRSLAAVLERDADEIFQLTAEGLSFFGEVFGMRFPEHKYDQVFLPEMGGAMENYGCVTWSDSFLRRSAPTYAERELLAKVLLHEMAHMWFGNIVTMRWWDDLWLNEAFAEFACNWAAERATRYTDAWASHLAEDKLEAYLADQGPTSHPIRLPVRDVAEAASFFDSITYPKGASVLQQLMVYLGEERFERGMKAYFARHAWGSTVLQDLVDALESAGGRDLDAWRRGWLETAGTDRITLESGASGFTVVARGPQGPPRPHALHVAAYRRTPDGLARVASRRVEVVGERTPVDLPAGAELYLVNDDDLTFATTRPDPGSRRTLLAEAAELPSAVSRGVAVATVWDMLVTGEATAAEAVGVLVSVLARETSDTVVEPYVSLAAECVELWAPDDDRPTLRARLTTACRSLAGDADRRRVALRGAVRAAPDLDALDDVEDLAAHADGDDVDLRWRILERRAELGALDAGALEDLEARDPDPDAWVRALAVRVAAPSAEAKAEFWRRVAEERAVPVASVGQVAAAFWRPGQDALLRPYAAAYLDAIPRLEEGGMIPAMVYTRRLFPLFGVDGDFPERAVEAAAGTAPVVRARLTERADLVARMLRSRAGSIASSV
jgi:aminopeptidase N